MLSSLPKVRFIFLLSRKAQIQQARLTIAVFRKRNIDFLHVKPNYLCMLYIFDTQKERAKRAIVHSDFIGRSPDVLGSVNIERR